MNYQEFSDFFLRFLWREGDTDLSSDLEHYIRAAESRLNRDLKVQQMEQPITVPLEATALDLAWPTYIRSVDSITDDATGQGMVFVSPRKLLQMRSVYSVFEPFYTIIGRSFRFVAGIDVSNPREFTLDVHRKVPSLKDDDSSWVLDDYFDLYYTAVACEVMAYLKNDPRTPAFEQKYQERLESARAANHDAEISEAGTYMPDGVW